MITIGPMRLAVASVGLSPSVTTARSSASSLGVEQDEQAGEAVLGLDGPRQVPAGRRLPPADGHLLLADGRRRVHLPAVRREPDGDEPVGLRETRQAVLEVELAFVDDRFGQRGAAHLRKSTNDGWMTFAEAASAAWYDTCCICRSVIVLGKSASSTSVRPDCRFNMELSDMVFMVCTRS